MFSDADDDQIQYLRLQCCDNIKIRDSTQCSSHTHHHLRTGLRYGFQSPPAKRDDH